jgi:hypothetical protein
VSCSHVHYVQFQTTTSVGIYHLSPELLNCSLHVYDIPLCLQSKLYKETMMILNTHAHTYIIDTNKSFVWAEFEQSFTRSARIFKFWLNYFCNHAQAQYIIHRTHFWVYTMFLSSIFTHNISLSMMFSSFIQHTHSWPS